MRYYVYGNISATENQQARITSAPDVKTGMIIEGNKVYMSIVTADNKMTIQFLINP